ncbi:BnaCnng23550D [Brassica napus]|uniref:BnaCnng23550D protein n=1 Tax=Brassica napus TaxID=3708 RepID=A0A078ISK4_BRANA|nr:BnaCnng23550D [Brassica napus]
MSKDFEPFAYKGMSGFLGALESKCPATAEFKDLFVKVADYMACFKSGIKVEMQEKSVKLFRAISVLDGTNGETSVDSWRMVDGMLSMGILVTEMKKNVSQEITFEQRKELIGAMVKWARAIGLLVKTASEKKGQSIDLASFGVDYSPHVASPIKGANGEL